MPKLIDTDRYNALVKARYGYVLFNKNDLYIGRAIEKYGEFSEGEVVVFRQVCAPGHVVIDVGANIGTHTMAFSQFVQGHGRVYALEPQRIVFQTLCANMALNTIENVECFQIAAADSEGHVLFPDIHYDQFGNFGGVGMVGYTYGKRIRTARLDDLFDLPQINFIKIDVEGMEHAVIRGAAGIIERHRPVLYVENDRTELSAALIQLIQSFDYRLYWHQPGLFNPDNFAGDSEDIYPGTMSVNMFCVHRSREINLMGFDEITDCNEHPLHLLA